jgi:chloramphenicol-sensitive protein RarD
MYTLAMQNKGTLAALGAYFLWGLFPIYWKLLQDVDASEILAHRMLWSFVFMLMLMAWGREWRWLKTAVSQPRILFLFVLSATLLGINWLTYIWGVTNGYIVDTSLGYFINPLVNVLLGVLFLRERPRNGQWLAIGVATIGVVYLAVSYGVVLWISLTLAFSFAFYGLLRKTSSLNSWEGLTLETAVFFLPAFGYLFFLEGEGTAAFGHISTTTTLLLMGTGIATSVPLLLFAYGARQVTLTTLGILQYIAPSMQFILGVAVYNEPFTLARIVGFSIIWLALAIYSGENIWQRRRRRRMPLPLP